MRTCVIDVHSSVLSKEAQDRFAWLDKNCGTHHPELKDLILSHGGHAVCLYLEEDAQNIQSKGQYFPGGKENVVMRKGAPCQCHYNSSRLWKRHKYYKICTGYALSHDNDGLHVWRQHSWCINARGNVVETTELRVAYFGFIMSHEEAEQFYLENT